MKCFDVEKSHAMNVLSCLNIASLRIVNVKSSQSQQRSFKYSTVAKSACLIVKDGQGGNDDKRLNYGMIDIRGLLTVVFTCI